MAENENQNMKDYNVEGQTIVLDKEKVPDADNTDKVQMKNIQQMQMQMQMQMQEMQMQMQSGKSNVGKSLVEDFKMMLTKPVDMAKSYISKKDVTNSVLFIVLQAIISAIFIAVNCIMINESMAESMVGKSFQVPTFKLFMVTFVLSIISSFVFATSIFLVLKISSIGTSYVDAINIVASKSAVLVIMDLIACVVRIVSPSFSIALFELSLVVGLIYITIVLSSVLAIDDNKKTFLVSVIVCVYAVIMCLLIATVLKEISDGNSINSLFNSSMFMR